MQLKLGLGGTAVGKMKKGAPCRFRGAREILFEGALPALNFYF